MLSDYTAASWALCFSSCRQVNMRMVLPTATHHLLLFNMGRWPQSCCSALACLHHLGNSKALFSAKPTTGAVKDTSCCIKVLSSTLSVWYQLRPRGRLCKQFAQIDVFPRATAGAAKTYIYQSMVSGNKRNVKIVENRKCRVMFLTYKLKMNCLLMFTS